jgi:hypothetical protein
MNLDDFIHDYFVIIGDIIYLLYSIQLLKTYYDNRLEIKENLNQALFHLSFISTFNYLFLSIIIKDIYIFIGTVTGVIAYFGIINILYKILDINYLIYIELFYLTYFIYYISVIYTLLFSDTDIDIMLQIINYVNIITSLMCTFSPLLIIKEVIKTKKTDLIYIPSLPINIITSICWLFYGINQNIISLIITNIITLIITIVQILVIFYCYIYKKYSYNTINI